MFKFITKFLQSNNIATITTENQEMITQELPVFDFSHFHNHTMIDVVIVPVSEDNNKIKLYLPKNMLDLIDLEMKDSFHIRFKSDSHILIKGKNNPRIEIPANTLKSINNYSMGCLTVKDGIEVQNKIVNEGSGNVSVGYFTGNNIKNDSMGKVGVKIITTNKLKLSSDGSGNVEIFDGSIDNLESDTNSMGKVTIKAKIDCAKVISNGSGNTDIGYISSSIVVKLNSMGHVNIEGLISESVKAYSSGSGKLVINNINTQNLNVDLSSMGNVEINGKSLASTLDSSGSGTIKGSLCSEDFKINMSSMGNVNVEPLKLLTVKIEGMGNLNLSGEHILDSVDANLKSMGKIKGENIKTHALSVSGRANQCDITLVAPFKKPKM